MEEIRRAKRTRSLSCGGESTYIRTHRAIGAVGVPFGQATACRRRCIWLPGPREREGKKKRKKGKERKRKGGKKIIKEEHEVTAQSKHIHGGLGFARRNFVHLSPSSSSLNFESAFEIKPSKLLSTRRIDHEMIQRAERERERERER